MPALIVSPAHGGYEFMNMSSIARRMTNRYGAGATGAAGFLAAAIPADRGFLFGRPRVVRNDAHRVMGLVAGRDPLSFLTG
jgi:hypothetical protein